MPFAAFGIGAVRAWVPDVAEVQPGPPVPASADAVPRPEAGPDLDPPRGKCPECGIIESRREVWSGADGTQVSDAAAPSRPARDHTGPRSLVTVRMSNGARHQFVDSASASWRPGERVILIRGS